MHTPVTVETVRAEKPASKTRPAKYAVTANDKLPSPRSAANTLPRKRSSEFNCSNVVEKTQTVDPPACASIAQAAAIHTVLLAPSKQYPAAIVRYPKRIPKRSLRSSCPAHRAEISGPISAPTPRPPSNMLIPSMAPPAASIPRPCQANSRAPITVKITQLGPTISSPALAKTAGSSAG